MGESRERKRERRCIHGSPQVRDTRETKTGGFLVSYSLFHPILREEACAQKQSIVFPWVELQIQQRSGAASALYSGQLVRQPCPLLPSPRQGVSAASSGIAGDSSSSMGDRSRGAGPPPLLRPPSKNAAAPPALLGGHVAAYAGASGPAMPSRKNENAPSIAQLCRADRGPPLYPRARPVAHPDAAPFHAAHRQVKNKQKKR